MTLKIALLASDVAALDDYGKLLLHTDPQLDLVFLRGELENAQQALDEEAPDLLLLCTSPEHTDNQILAVLQELAGKRQLERVAVIRANLSLELLMAAMRTGLREVLTPPLPEADIVALLERVRSQQHPPPAPTRQGRVYAFTPSKGGSGSTFLATNVAHTLAENPKQSVLLIDLHLQFGDAALFLCDGGAPATVVDITQQIGRLDASLLAASTLQLQPNLHILPASDDVEKNRAVTGEQIERLVRLARDYDYVILDVSRSLDPSCLTALRHADGIFLVVQLTLPFLRGGKGQISLLRAAGVAEERIHPVVNRMEKTGDIGLEDVERSLGRPVFFALPNRYEIVAGAINRGIPVRKHSSSDPISKAMGEFAQRLGRPEGLLSWIRSTLARIPFVGGRLSGTSER